MLAEDLAALPEGFVQPDQCWFLSEYSTFSSPLPFFTQPLFIQPD